MDGWLPNGPARGFQKKVKKKKWHEKYEQLSRRTVDPLNPLAAAQTSDIPLADFETQLRFFYWGFQF
ncbi:hypothetical protein LINGRAHAP2_LOCUS8660 [Linum grandiflorum]